MKKLLPMILNLVLERLNDPEYQKRSKTTERAFTRKRKIGFEKIMQFLLNFLRKSLQLEVDEFQEALREPEDLRASMDAYIKARGKIKPEALRELFDLSAETCMASEELPTYREYRVFADDGTTLHLEGTKDILEHTGAHRNTPKRAEARASILCEVHTGIVIDASIDSLHVGEREQAEAHLARFFQCKREKDVVLFDRGYPSDKLIAYFFDNDGYFLFRLPKSFHPEVDAMGYGEQCVDIRHNGTTYRMRAMRFRLKSGEDELLLTNLPQEDFPTDTLPELYALRWGVETQYDTLKNRLQLENFSGRIWQYVLQDFYATMFLSNIVALARASANTIIATRDMRKTLKYPHTVSTNVLIGKLKHKLLRALATDNPRTRQRRLNKILREASLCYDCVRPYRLVPPRSAKDSHHKKVPLRKQAL